ncbi:capsular biosynthesis protein [Tissierella creatinini]|nr:capsular biosynthesis protein [Tissierella creatinini]TJX60538.1 capsular biosynthesis protein [Soehngenia saccharolytica]
MIDIHSHILPYMDDGSKDMDMSLRIAEIYVENGIYKVIATPHYMDGVMYKSNEELRIGLENLKKSLARAGIPLELYPGNEVYIKPDIIDDLEKGKISTLNDSRYILIELPMNEIPIYVEELIYELCIKGYVPIIAHPERYTKISKDPNILYRYISMGALAQINLKSIEGFYGSRVKNTAELLLKHKMIHFVGSDSHSSNHRSPDLRNSLNILSDLVDDKYFDQLTFKNQEAVLKNKAIDIIPPKKVVGQGDRNFVHLIWSKLQGIFFDL